jgi:hypothetical protein
MKRSKLLVEVMPSAARTLLKLTDEQNKQLDALQPEFEAKVVGILSEEQNKQLKEPPKGAPPFVPSAAPQAIRVLPAPTPRESSRRLPLTRTAQAR